MNIELDEVVALDVSDDVLELAAGGLQAMTTVYQSWPNVGQKCY